ncbi:MAG: threonine/serine exporter family protein [Planctomycetes bacterium]|nr:threonine/serine exporter family protein [Planctomycetota bacterium]
MDSKAAHGPDGTARAFVMELGAALHRYGAMAPRVEQAMELAAARFELAGQFFATPTSIFAAFGEPGHQAVGLMRVEPGRLDLDKRCALDELLGDALHGRVTPQRGLERLAEIERAPVRWGPFLTTLCYGLSSAAAARFLGGGWLEMAAATFVGWVAGLLVLAAERSRWLRGVFEPTVATIASALALVLATQLGELSTFTVTVAGLIVFLPGLTMTTAMSELALRHLAAGTARFMGAVLTLLALALGVVLGRQVERVLPTLPQVGEHAPPEWSLGVALLVAPISIAILMQARPRDLGWIVVAGVIAFFGASSGGEVLGADVGAFLGAFAVGAASNLFGRVLQRPSVVTMVPGLLVLVPGSLGFRSLLALLERDTLSGIDAAFSMVMVAISLAAGLLLANVVITPRRLDAAG